MRCCWWSWRANQAARYWTPRRDEAKILRWLQEWWSWWKWVSDQRWVERRWKWTLWNSFNTGGGGGLLLSDS